MKYQLPCKCGQSVNIEPSQAGQTVVCVCGEHLLVPSMLQIKALPAAPEIAKSPRKETGVLRITFLIIGIVLLIPSTWLALHLYANQPKPRDVLSKRIFFSYGSYQRPLYQDSTPIPEAEHTILWITDEDIDHLMPMDLFFYFRTLKEPMFSINFIDNYEAIKDTYRIRIAANALLFFLALLSIVASFFMPKQNVVVTGWSGSEWQ